MRALRFGRSVLSRESLQSWQRRTWRPTLELLEDRLAPATLNWIGGGATNAWSDSSNWRDAATSAAATPGTGDTLNFNTAAAGWVVTNAFALSSNNDLTGLSLANLAINDAATGDFNIVGNTITLTGSSGAGITNSTNGTTTIGLTGLTLGNSINVTNTTGSLNLRPNIDLGAFNLTFNGASTGTISVGTAGSTTQGVISGAGQVIMAGSGTLGLAGPSTYQGGTILNNGVLAPSVNSTFVGGVLTTSSLGTGVLTVNGGQLRATTAGAISVGNDVVFNTNVTFPSASTSNLLTLTGAVNLGGAARTLTVTNAAGITFTGDISNGGLIKAGTSTLILTGTYSGDITVTAGTLQLGATASVNGAITVQPGAVLRLDAATSLAAAAQITLLSSPTQLAMLDIRYDGALPTVTATSSGVLALGSGTYSQDLNLATLGDGTFYLGASANTTFTGNLTVGAGNVYRLGGGGGQLAIANPVLTSGNRVVVGVSDPNNAAVNGLGTVVLLSSNGYTGGTTIHGGSTLVIGAGGADTPLGTGAVTVWGNLIAAGANGSFRNAAGTANSNAITLLPGSLLRFDNHTAYQGLAAGNNNDRWADATAIALDGSTLELFGQNVAAGSSETVGAITFDKGSTVSIKRGTAGNTTLTAASLTRVGQGTLALMTSAANTLGAATNADRFIVTTPPPRGTAASGATVNMVAPYILNVSNAGTNISYVDYDPSGTTGFKDVVYKTVSALADWDTVTEASIVDVTGAIAASGLVKTVYALRATAGAPGLTGTATVTLTSGGLIYGSLGSSPTWNFVFGSAATPGEALVWLNADKNPAQSGTFTANGLTLTATPQGRTGNEALILTSSNAATLTGTITVHSGFLQLQSTTGTAAPTSISSASTIVLNGGGLRIRNNGAASNQTLVYDNNIIVAASAALSVDRVGGTTTGNTAQFNNLTIGNNTLTVTGGNSYAVRFNGTTTLTGDATFSVGNTAAPANLTLNGVIDDGAGTFSITKAGTSTLFLNAANTYGGVTVVALGTLELAAAGAALVNSDVIIATIFGQSAALRLNNAAAALTLNQVRDGLGSSSMQVDRGTLTITNGLTIDALRVAQDQTGSTAVTALLTVTGAVVIGDGTTDLDIGRMTSNASIISGTLDLTGAASVIINVVNLRLGSSTVGGGAGTTAGTLLLSSAGVNQVTATSVAVGDVGDSGNSNISVTSRLTLGAGLNRFRVEEMYVSRRKSVGIVSFATPTSGGTFDLAGKSGSAANLFIGDNSVTSTMTSINGTGTLDLTGGTFNAVLDQLVVGRFANVAAAAAAGSGSGTLTMTAGTVTASSVLVAQAGVSTNNTGNVGTLNLNGGTLSTGSLTAGQNRGQATVNVAGGTLNVTNTLSLAPTNANATVAPTTTTITVALNISAGVVNAGTVLLTPATSTGTGARANATVNINGGTLNAASVSWTPASTTGLATATINLSSGTLAAATLARTGATGAIGFNWTGGTLRNLAGSDLVNSNVSIAVTGAAAHTLVVDDGRTATLQAALTGDGALTKEGAGRLILQADSTAYTGTVFVAAGMLLANNTVGSAMGTNTVTVQNGGTLGGTGRVAGAVSVQLGGAVAPGDAGPGTLTLGSSLTLAQGSALRIDVQGAGAGQADLLVVGGAVDLNLATLILTLGGSYVPTAGDTFVFLDNGSTETPEGTRFDTLPSTGSVLVVDGQVFHIAYNADDGNDLALTVNRAPTFTSFPVTAASEDVAYSYSIATGDADAGDTRTITGSLPAWLTLVDHGDGTATLSGTPSNAEVGSHTITLTVTDAGGATATQTFTITVANVNDAPTFTSTPVTSATEDVAYSYAITTGDIDVGDTRTITGVLPAWLTLVDTGNGTATLSGTPGNADVGNHSITLTVTDAAGAATVQTFTITVANVNDAPTFTSTPDTTADQDAPYSYAIATGDVDVGDTRTITGSFPAWLTLVDNGNGTATLSGTPTNAEVGTHSVTLTVTDAAGASATQTFTITVGNVNDAPTFTSTPVTAATEDAAYSYAIATGDIDVGDTRTITGTLPAWLTLVDHGNGTATLSGTPTNAQVGTYSVTLTVTDAAGDSATQTFTITVANVNDAPVLTPTAPSLPGILGQADPASNQGVLLANLVGGNISDIDAGALKGIAVTGFTTGAGGTWQYQLSAGGPWVSFPPVSAGAPLLLNADGDTRVRFQPSVNTSGTPTLTFRAWDRTDGGVEGTIGAVAGTGSTFPFSAAEDTARITVTRDMAIQWTSQQGFVSQIAVATNASGTITAFGIGGDGALWYRTQNVGEDLSSFAGWTSMGGFVKQFTVGHNADGTLQVFAVGGDNAAWTNREVGGAFTSGGWQSLGGGVKQLAVGLDGNGRLELFAIGGDNALYVKVQNVGGGFGAWANLGGYVTQIVVAANADNTLQVFAIGGDQGLWTNKQTVSGSGAFSGWQALGGYVLEIAVGANQDGSLQVFAIGGDHALWTRKQSAGPSSLSAGFTPWASLGGYINEARVVVGPTRSGPPVTAIVPGALTVGRHTDGTLQVFAIGGDNAAWGRRQATAGGSDASGFLPWLSNGGYVRQLAAGANDNLGWVQVFAVGGDNALWTRTPVAPSALMLASVPGIRQDAPLSESAGHAALAESLRRSAAAGWAPTQPLQLQIADLPGTTLGLYAAGTIVLDADAAGQGWFIDPTPSADEEFDGAGRALAGSAAAGRVDLLSVVMHELGHAAGLDHDSGWMADALAVSTRLR